jgi:hypothetical protein
MTAARVANAGILLGFGDFKGLAVRQITLHPLSGPDAQTDAQVSIWGEVIRVLRCCGLMVSADRWCLGPIASILIGRIHPILAQSSGAIPATLPTGNSL